MTRTAIMVDGGFYRKRAKRLWGDKSPQARADELGRYIFKHLAKTDGRNSRDLYRVFYYDCPPVDKVVYHPLLQRNVDFGRSGMKRWANAFFDELKRKRKFALRLGRLSDSGIFFQLDPRKVKELCCGDITVADLEESDFRITFHQKGVDMRLGLDIADLANGHLVDQIILIAGDSDFVPAAKIARRKGIDFILDPMGGKVSDDLMEHIDGLEYFVSHDPCISLHEDNDQDAFGEDAAD